ncbi:MAG: PspA/IM30 family protein [bacterium]|nr:PspA/IM30 family protein [bacterium]
MRTVKNIFISLGSVIDSAASAFTNHEALVNEKIKSMEKSLIQARLNYTRLAREIKRIENDLKNKHDDIQLWTDRARNSKDSNLEIAKECLKRKISTEQMSSTLKGQHEHLLSLQKRLFNDISEGESRLNYVKGKQRACLARQYESETRSALKSSDEVLDSDLDQLFFSWEEQSSLTADTLNLNDPIAEHFSESEMNQLLESELRNL